MHLETGVTKKPKEEVLMYFFLRLPSANHTLPMIIPTIVIVYIAFMTALFTLCSYFFLAFLVVCYYMYVFNLRYKNYTLKPLMLHLRSSRLANLDCIVMYS